jgi:hypothetical protein
MIIQLPPYTQAQYDNIDYVATCSIDSPNSPYQMHVMSIQVCYTDLVVRPLVDAYLSYDSAIPTTYGLRLTVTNDTRIHINSKHLPLLNFIMQSIVFDTDVTLDLIKSNFPELLI